jgi:uncharacterized membrane protein
MRRLLPGLLGLLIAAGFSFWAYAQLPARVATHWGFDGRADGWSSPLVAAIFVPAIGLVVALIFLALPKIDPRQEAYRDPRSPYWIVSNAVLVLLVIVHTLVLGHALGWVVNAVPVVTTAVGLLFVLIGALMPRMRPSWFMGIRTPWTLSNDEVWVRTHRLGAKLFVAAGAAIAVSGVLPGNWWIVGAIGLAAVLALAPVVYSWWLWRTMGPEGRRER